jgi:hypothetical protein
VPDRPLAGPCLGRRSAILGLAATFLVAGCDHGDDLGESTSNQSPSAPTSAPTSAATATSSAPAQTPDEALVDEVNSRLSTALAVAINAWKAPELRQAMAPLVKAHRQQLRVLEGELPAEAPPGPKPGAAAALRSVRHGEQELHAVLVDAAGRAESGALAKLLASISASVTQHLAVLPERVGG